MSEEAITVERKTKETAIFLRLDFLEQKPPEVTTGVPFFDHILTSFAFHGGFGLILKAEGDLSVDAHHLVEDTGLVLGQALDTYTSANSKLNRFGWVILPMDEALAEVAVDVCGRPTLVYRANYPQKLIGNFDVSLVREFLAGLVQKAKISLHINLRYGKNSHHMAEALFKALGKALAQAYQICTERKLGLSTKGTL